MGIVIKRKEELLGTTRHVQNHAYETVRFLLEPDGAGVTVTDILIKPGIEEVYGYKEHIEVAYCLEGHATLTDLSDGSRHEITAGTLWAATKHEQFRFIAHRPTRLICVFTPPFTGAETGFSQD
jgi:L-ectoine synthase